MHIKTLILHIIAGMSSAQLKNIRSHYENITDLLNEIEPISMKLHLVLNLFRSIKKKYDDKKYIIHTDIVETKKIIDLIIIQIQALSVCSKTKKTDKVDDHYLSDDLHLSDDLVKMIKEDIFLDMVFKKIFSNSNLTKMTVMIDIIFQDFEKVSKKRKRISNKKNKENEVSKKRKNKENKFVLDDSFLEQFSNFNLNEDSSKLELVNDEDKKDENWTPECES